MGSVNARVDNVSADTLASTVVVDVLAGASLAVGDTAKTPSGVILSNVSIDAGKSVLLNVLNLET